MNIIMESNVRTGSSHKLSIKVVSLTLAISFSMVYVLCLLYGLASPTKLHVALFETLPFFNWLNPASVLIGLTEFFVAGLFYGTIVVLIYNYFIGRIR